MTFVVDLGVLDLNYEIEVINVNQPKLAEDHKYMQHERRKRRSSDDNGL